MGNINFHIHEKVIRSFISVFWRFRHPSPVGSAETTVCSLQDRSPTEATICVVPSPLIQLSVSDCCRWDRWNRNQWVAEEVWSACKVHTTAHLNYECVIVVFVLEVRARDTPACESKQMLFPWCHTRSVRRYRGGVTPEPETDRFFVARHLILVCSIS